MIDNVKNIIFDLDNTLYDFSKIWEKANKDVFCDLGYNKLTDYETFFTVYKKHNSLILERIKNGEVRLRELRTRRIIDTLKEFGYIMSGEESIRYYKRQFEFMELELKPNYELIEKIKKLKQYYNISILTNGKSKEQRSKISKLGFENLFRVYISEETWFDKPHQAAFFNVLENEKYIASETLMVGDSLFHDIEPAEKLGLKTCLIDKKWHFDENNVNDSYTGFKVNNIDEIIDILLKSIK